MNDSLNFMPITMRGEIRRVVFETSDGGYAVLRVLDENDKEFTVVGPIVSPCEGQTIEVTGLWEKHAEYGQQLRANSYRYTLPSTKRGLTRYLASGVIPGVGKTLAEAIVNHFGENTLNTLDNYPNALLEVPKIGKKKAKAIVEAWKESGARREVFIFLQGLGITPAYCNRLFKRYGEQAAEAVKQNPYRLAEEVDGIGFKRADEIALELGIPETAIERMTAAAVFAINQTISFGHVGYPENLLIDEMAKLVNQNYELLAQGINNAIKRKLLTRRDELIYSPILSFAELEIPKHVHRLANANKFAGQKCAITHSNPNLSLCAGQLHAVERVSQRPLTIITGGPGVGKTTVVSEIVRRAKTAHLRIALAAPTGRAAKRLSEATNLQAKTIHRLLQYDGASGKFVHNETTPLQVDLIVIDEVSMLDVMLAMALLRAIKTGTSVIFVGDSDQLPSVGPGTVLADFIKCTKYFLTTHLTQIFRQGKGSEIILNSHIVNRGQKLVPKIPTKDNELGDFYWIQQDDIGKIQSIIERLLLDRIPKCFDFNIDTDVQILTPMNRGNGGSLALNEFLQNTLNGHEPVEFRYGEKVFKLHDKVIQNSNNYDKNVYNGDLGRISYINSNKKIFTVTFDDGFIVDYNFDEADQLTMAYAITIHKSQGSEFKVVILILLPQHYVMLKRNLLYTGMTRAKKLLILIGSEKIVNVAIQNHQSEVRYTKLLKYLNEDE